MKQELKNSQKKMQDKEIKQLCTQYNMTEWCMRHHQQGLLQWITEQVSSTDGEKFKYYKLF